MKIILTTAIFLTVAGCGDRPSRIISQVTSASGDLGKTGSDAQGTAANPASQTVPYMTPAGGATPVANPAMAPSVAPSTAAPSTAAPSTASPSMAPQAMAPASQPAPASPATAPATQTDPTTDKFKAMLASKRMVTEYIVTDANYWGTSKNSRINLYVAVDAQGKAIVPTGIRTPEVTGDLDPSKDMKFATTQMHSVFKVCNKSKVDIRLHAQPGIPFDHSIDNIRKGACTIYLLTNANAIGDDKSWDHNIGIELPVYFNVVKIKPDGTAQKASLALTDSFNLAPEPRVPCH